MLKNLKGAQPVLVKLLLVFIFVSTGFIYLLNFKGTAVTWPASDNLPGVCRLLQANCLAEDFFTNASSGVTPRLPYAYFLSEITRISNNGIGGGLAVIKSLLLILLPAIAAFLFIVSVKTHIDCKGRNEWVISPVNVVIVASAPLFVFLLQGRVGAYLSVAWWAPLYFDATAHNVSLLLTILGFLLVWGGVRVIGAAFVILGALVHPAVGLFASIFSCVVLCKFDSFGKNFRFFGFGLGASIAGAILVKLLFEGGGSLSAEDFVRVYAVEAHPAHYIPSQFGSLSSMPWVRSFTIVAVGLLAVTVALYKLKSVTWKNSFLAFIAYSSSVLVQFLFVEIFQIKLIAALGPSRFTMFGLWFLCIFCFVAVLKFIEGGAFIRKTSDVILQCLAHIRWVHILICYFILGSAAVFYAYKSSHFDLPDDSQMLAEFASTKTKISDVFVLPFYAPRVDFPLKTGRAIFIGNGFPFSEKYFHEWDDRNAIVNGRNAEITKLPGSWIGDKYANHYRQLLPNDFIAAAAKYKIDWVVIEADHSEKFSSCKADFDSPKYKVYSLLTLQRCIR